MLQVGDMAPDFLGVDELGNEVRVSDYAAVVLLYISIPKTAHPAALPRLARCAMV